MVIKKIIIKTTITTTTTKIKKIFKGRRTRAAAWLLAS
jgi:hypothetical protein